jgi:hypothetical protein
MEFEVEALLCSLNPDRGSLGARCFSCQRKVFTAREGGQHIIERFRDGVLLTPYCPPCALQLNGAIIRIQCPCHGRWHAIPSQELRVLIGVKFMQEAGEQGFAMFSALLANAPSRRSRSTRNG